MSIKVRPFKELAPGTIAELDRQLADYYSHPPTVYYQIANKAAAQYAPDIQPFHCDLVSRIEPGRSLLELGCGSAHLCPYVEKAGATYTGLDHSDELLADNRRRFPDARFLSISANPDERFDIVASLYTLEHVVDPPAYLERMWNFCKPGGLLAIICPDFVDGHGMSPSFYYGETARRFREKIRRFAFIDAARHVIDLIVTAPRWKSQAKESDAGAFWINLKPRVLHGAEYSIDADAVHLPRLTDIVSWLEGRGASMVATSHSLKNIPEFVLRYNCYALARKPI